MSKMGRPKKDEDFNFQQFELLCSLPSMACTQDTICDIMSAGGIQYSKSTLQRIVKEHYGCTFDQFRLQKQGGIKAKLALKQIDVALKGSVPMLIWLGKNVLDQSEKVEQKQTIVTDHKFKIGFEEENDRTNTSTQNTSAKTDPAIN